MGITNMKQNRCTGFRLPIIQKEDEDEEQEEKEKREDENKKKGEEEDEEKKKKVEEEEDLESNSILTLNPTQCVPLVI